MENRVRLIYTEKVSGISDNKDEIAVVEVFEVCLVGEENDEVVAHLVICDLHYFKDSSSEDGEDDESDSIKGHDIPRVKTISKSFTDLESSDAIRAGVYQADYLRFERNFTSAVKGGAEYSRFASSVIEIGE